MRISRQPPHRVVFTLAFLADTLLADEQVERLAALVDRVVLLAEAVEGIVGAAPYRKCDTVPGQPARAKVKAGTFILE